MKTIPDFPHHGSDSLRLLDYEATAQVPRLSTAAIMNAPDEENRQLRILALAVPANPRLLAGKRVALLATDGVEELELTLTYRYFRERGADIHVVAPARPIPPPRFGVQYPAIRDTHILTARFMENGGWFPFDRTVAQLRVDDYDAVIVPGGAWNPLGLRADAGVVEFIRLFFKAGKLTCGICHGPMVFIEAGILTSRKATSFWDMMTDMRNAGADVSDRPLVIDGNLVTSRFIYDLPPFLAAITERLLATS